MIYLSLQEDAPNQRYLIVDSGTAAVRLGEKEAEEMAIEILRLLSGSRQPLPNVIDIAAYSSLRGSGGSLTAQNRMQPR
jgi:hypothetical protein